LLILFGKIEGHYDAVRKISLNEITSGQTALNITAIGLVTFWIASNRVAALAVSQSVVPKLKAQFSILKQRQIFVNTDRSLLV